MSDTSEEITPVLYSYFRSSASWRVRLALAWKGVEYETRLVNLLTRDNHKKEYLDINPTGKVPTFETKEGKLLFQSMAIMEYLEETYPDRPILPSGPIHRARVRAICQIIACDIHPLQNLSVLRYLSDDKEKQEEWARHFISRGFDGLQKELETLSGTYTVGEHITMADFFLVPMVQNAYRNNLDMKPYPLITRIFNTLMTLPEFKQTHPFVQPDCPPELRIK
ncbi:glutathione S-transferase [Phycomyces nitens]|nr:glutathione S-transferase [Phycomyces nitens]